MICWGESFRVSASENSLSARNFRAFQFGAQAAEKTGSSASSWPLAFRQIWPEVRNKWAQICSYNPPETAAQSKKLADKTRIPLATHLREVADDLLIKYADALQQQSPKSQKEWWGSVLSQNWPEISAGQPAPKRSSHLVRQLPSLELFCALSCSTNSEF